MIMNKDSQNNLVIIHWIATSYEDGKRWKFPSKCSLFFSKTLQRVILLELSDQRTVGLTYRTYWLTDLRTNMVSDYS
jgi:hypothetical protein